MGDPDDDERQPWQALVDAARAWVAWEAELGGAGVPEVEPMSRDAGLTADDGAPRAMQLAPQTPTSAHDRAYDVGPANEPRRDSGSAVADPRAMILSPSMADRAADDVGRRLEVLAEEARACTACRLHEGRSRSVFARGSSEAIVAFVGDGPGDHEDQAGAPFVGPAGQLLDKMIAAMGLSPDEVYVCNLVKCRPPTRGTPGPDEASACARFWVPQLELVAPKVIVALGRLASERLGGVAPEVRDWRGTWAAWRGIPVMSTFHPDDVLQRPAAKRPVWTDLQAVVAKLGRKLPTRRR